MFATGTIDARVGPLISVRISNPIPWQRALEAEGQLGLTPPRPLTGLALVDTGATRSMILPTTADALRACRAPAVGIRGLHPSKPWSTAAPEFVEAVYVMVEIVGAAVLVAVHAPKLPFAAALERPDILLLLGRDVLGHVLLSWNGPSGTFEIRSPG